MPQEDINALLVGLARDGLKVVRLKGGDPFVFGRGGEELLACRAAGVECHVVPGVSAALAAGAGAGAPLTHRGLSQSVTFVTGHAAAGAEPDLDWTALARTNQTVVVYMGLSTAPAIAARLIAAGRQSSTPVLVVESASLPHERRVASTLAELGAQTLGLEGPRDFDRWRGRGPGGCLDLWRAGRSGRRFRDDVRPRECTRMKALTANDLPTGEVIFWSHGRWVEHFGEAEVFDGDLADAALADAEAQPTVAVAPYLIDLQDGPEGPVPVSYRERLRGARPHQPPRSRQAGRGRRGHRSPQPTPRRRPLDRPAFTHQAPLGRHVPLRRHRQGVSRGPLARVPRTVRAPAVGRADRGSVQDPAADEWPLSAAARLYAADRHPLWLVSTTQLRRLAHIARVFDKGYGHFTTRTNLQLHWIKLRDAPDILDQLAEVDLHAIQTSGNCVRNVTRRPLRRGGGR